jgi:sec-independent protein translocase protein TatA
MIGDILQPTHLIFVLVVALLVLGPKRLPEAGRALGGAIRDFRSAMGGEHDHPSEIVTQAPAPPPSTAVAMAPPAEPAPHVATEPAQAMTQPTEPTEPAHEPDQVEQGETVHPIG